MTASPEFSDRDATIEEALARLEAPPLVEFEIVVPAMPRHLEDIHLQVARLWREVERVWPRPPDPTWRAQFATGIGEIAANIVQYAYPADTGGDLGFRVRIFRDGIQACFSDSGRDMHQPIDRYAGVSGPGVVATRWRNRPHQIRGRPADLGTRAERGHSLVPGKRRA